MINNVLVIPDLHAPFIHPKALKHCAQVYKQYKCNKVIFIGDLIDNASTTRWDTNPDGKSAGDELNLATKQLKAWYKTFPKAIVTIGNHDERITKKLKKGTVSNKWLKDFNEVLEVPNWEFLNCITIDGVTYSHGEGYTSTTQSLYQSNTSIVFGHFHSKYEIVYNNGKFGMCVGWLADQDAYAFDYARNCSKKGILGCAVVLNNGTLPILLPLNT
jgi:metallophosphoesterase superfamily enzyme